MQTQSREQIAALQRQVEQQRLEMDAQVALPLPRDHTRELNTVQLNSTCCLRDGVCQQQAQRAAEAQMRLHEEQEAKESELQRLRRELKEKEMESEEKAKDKQKGDSKLKQLRQQLKCQTEMLDDNGDGAVPGTPEWLRECRGGTPKDREEMPWRNSKGSELPVAPPKDREEMELNRLLQKYGADDSVGPYDMPGLAGTEGWHVRPSDGGVSPQPLSGRRGSHGAAPLPLVYESLASESKFCDVSEPLPLDSLQLPPRPAPASAPSGPQQSSKDWSKMQLGADPAAQNHTRIRVPTPKIETQGRDKFAQCSSAGRNREHALDPPTPSHSKNQAPDPDRFDTIDKVAERNARCTQRLQPSVLIRM
jgi:hypothetical protein